MFNGESFIARAIESVLNQSSPAVEVIVVDDGSTDGTPEVVARFGPQVRYVRQSNQGVSVARNAGAEAARGDWLAFLDADDWYFPERLRMHTEMIQTCPDLDFLTGDFEYRDSSGAFLGRSMERHALGRRILAKASGAHTTIMIEEDFEEFIADHFGDMHTLSVPRSKFLQLGGYPAGFKVCEDVHFLVRLLSASRLAGVVCKPLGVYLIHGESATRRDPLQAQRENVRTLLDIRRMNGTLTPVVRRGLRRLMARARTDLGYALIKRDDWGAAVRAVVPSLWEFPGRQSIRVVASVLRG